jgi:hypothetical protein
VCFEDQWIDNSSMADRDPTLTVDKNGQMGRSPVLLGPHPSRARTHRLEDCHGSRSPAIAALGEEAKDDYLLTKSHD